jgi:hypothetical protein
LRPFAPERFKFCEKIHIPHPNGLHKLLSRSAPEKLPRKSELRVAKGYLPSLLTKDPMTINPEDIGYPPSNKSPLPVEEKTLGKIYNEKLGEAKASWIEHKSNLVSCFQTNHEWALNETIKEALRRHDRAR